MVPQCCDGAEKFLSPGDYITSGVTHVFMAMRWTGFMEPTAVCSNVPGLHIRSPLTHSPEQLPVL